MEEKDDNYVAVCKRFLFNVFILARKCENLDKKSDLRRNDYILNTKRLYFALRN